jgi:hypothetical protein
MKKLFLSVAFLATAMSFGQTLNATFTDPVLFHANVPLNKWILHTPSAVGSTTFHIAPLISGTTYDWNKAFIISKDGRVGINGGNSTAKLTVNDGSINVVPWTTEPSAKIGFWSENDKMTTAQTGLVNPGGAANYGMTYSNFGTTAAGLPGISLAGYYGINFYTGAAEKMRLNGNGNLGIGTTTPTEKLDIVGNSKVSGKVGIGGVTTMTFPSTSPYASYNLFVKGGIASDEVRVALNATWADYVFAKDYNLKPLAEVEAFIAKNNHLPNVPSAAQVKEEGLALGDMSRIQQEKIEELTLYIIAQNKRLEALEAKMNTTK